MKQDTTNTGKQEVEKWTYDVIEKEGEIHIVNSANPTFVIASIYSLPLQQEDYQRAKLICSAPQLQKENKALSDSNKELREALKTAEEYLKALTEEDEETLKNWPSADAYTIVWQALQKNNTNQ